MPSPHRTSPEHTEIEEIGSQPLKLSETTAKTKKQQQQQQQQQKGKMKEAIGKNISGVKRNNDQNERL